MQNSKNVKNILFLSYYQTKQENKVIQYSLIWKMYK